MKGQIIQKEMMRFFIDVEELFRDLNQSNLLEKSKKYRQRLNNIIFRFETEKLLTQTDLQSFDYNDSDLKLDVDLLAIYGNDYKKLRAIQRSIN